MRPLFLALGLAATAASAQELDKCSSRCTTEMTSCSERCSAQMKCVTNCTNRMQDCITRCQSSAQAVETGGKGKKCYGADGKKMPCGTYKPVAPPKPTEDRQEYPNKSAKDLSKDPNFKGGEALQ